MRVSKITIEQYREIFGQKFDKDEYFKPIYDKDGNIIISEIEVNKMPPHIYPWKKDLVLVEPTEILKEFTKEEWIAFDIAETEKRLSELRSVEIIKDDNIEIKK